MRSSQIQLKLRSFPFILNIREFSLSPCPEHGSVKIIVLIFTKKILMKSLAAVKISYNIRLNSETDKKKSVKIKKKLDP